MKEVALLLESSVNLCRACDGNGDVEGVCDVCFPAGVCLTRHFSFSTEGPAYVTFNIRFYHKIFSV